MKRKTQKYMSWSKIVITSWKISNFRGLMKLKRLSTLVIKNLMLWIKHCKNMKNSSTNWKHLLRIRIRRNRRLFFIWKAKETVLRGDTNKDWLSKLSNMKISETNLMNWLTNLAKIARPVGLNSKNFFKLSTNTWWIWSELIKKITMTWENN